MIKKSRIAHTIIILFILLVAVTPQAFSVSTPAQKSAQFDEVFRLYESYDGSVYMGISGPYTNRSRAYSEAVSNAATMAALAQSIQLRASLDTEVETRRGIDSFDVVSRASYSGEIYNDVLMNLEIVEIRWMGGDIGAVAFIRYGNMPKVDWKHSSNWLRQLPEMDGYVFAVGQVDEYYYIQDSLNAATYAGAVSLMLSHPDSLFAISERINTNNADMRVYTSQVGYNVIQGFSVLAFDYDATSGVFSALVAARSN